ncbi:serine/threonine-protein kinase [Pseudonocardia sp. GCM10023141]|uniref:serine/threonine-protein kinase n=1 Tax=Pseudonocardia sp. GCM10023141 TaxID=3252653 RepID=UPI00360F6890
MPDARGDAGLLVGGRYRLHDVLGEGGMGAVWRATDELLGRVVAIKRVRLGSLPPVEAAKARERTMREARIAAALHHPHVVTIFDVVIEDDEPWLILEHVPSRSLGEILREHGTLPPVDVAAIGAQIAAGLAAAHAAGVVHRDVKPDNVLIAHPAGAADPLAGTTVKLTDFGISRVAQTSDITAADILSGTPAYLAPEAARGEGTGPRTDMYSLGATLYAAVEGHPPFGRDQGNVLALLTRVGRGGAPDAGHAGPLTAILRDLVADDPTVRPSAVDAHRVLRELAGTRYDERPVLRSVEPGPDPQPARTPAEPTMRAPFVVELLPPRRSRRSLVVATALLAAVAVGVGTAVVLAGTGDATPAASAPPGPPIRGGPITIPDQRAADPCSLLDVAALGRDGAAVLDNSQVAFSACRAVVTPAVGSPVAVSVEFEADVQVPKPLDATPEQAGPVQVVHYPPQGSRCVRRVLLPDGNDVLITAAGDAGPQLCAIADTGLDATVARLTVRGIGQRVVQGPTNRLAAAQACSLLAAPELAAVPGIDGSGRPGFGDWSCEWASSSGAYVRIAFARRPPITDADGTPATFAAHRGALRLTPGSDCFAQFGTRTSTGEHGAQTVDAVQVFVYRSLPDDQLCPAAATLAAAAAAKLPAAS